ncbi:hypothetical protein [Klebsiella quasipneumoniae]|uniref:hypothetical protein n=1 Tax=Klebsiella quasipneumoniae TaxID=1463165 RepID=UPI0027F2BC7E|nr:hypothetical protein [Klebsiella quasipneumoniae]
MTDITELALITKIKKQLENFDTVVLKEGEAVALVEALEKAQQRIDSQREYYEGVIADGGKRIADLESRTVKLPEPEQWDITQVLLCKKKVVAAIRAAGIKVEAE